MSVDGVEGIPVSLEEVLEVRNGPLTEDQVWAILARGVAPLQELSDIAGKSSYLILNPVENNSFRFSGKLRSSAYGLIPSSVFILSNGSVRFTSLPPQFRLEAEQFLAPESRMSEIDFIPSDYSKVK